MVEYALVLSLLSMAFITGMRAIESASFAVLSDIQTRMLDYGLEITP